MVNFYLIVLVICLLAAIIFMVVTDRFMLKKMKLLLQSSKRIEAEYTAKYVSILDELERTVEDKVLAEMYRAGKEYWVCESRSGYKFSIERPKCAHNETRVKRVQVCVKD
jgi:hypothetical protein